MLLNALAILLLALIPVVPKMLRLRIRVLRWMHWDWAADWLEKHFEKAVLFRRVALLGVALLLVLIP